MTDTAAEFESALDAQPNDWPTYLVYADWLEERGEERLAAAYRWCGENRVGMQKSHVWHFSHVSWWIGRTGDEYREIKLARSIGAKTVEPHPTRHAAMQALADALAESLTPH